MFEVQLAENHNNVLYVSFSFPVGSIFEDKQYAGVSHLLEHLLFESKDGLMDRLSRVGKWNASTGYDMTTFFIIGDPADYKDILRTLCDVTEALKITPKSFKNEKEIVVFEMFNSAGALKPSTFQLMWKGSPYANSIIGTPTSVNSVPYHFVKTHHKKYYTNGGIVVNAPREYHSRVLDEIKKVVDVGAAPKPLYPVMKNMQIRSKVPRVVLKTAHTRLDCLHMCFRTSGFDVSTHMHLQFLKHVLRKELNKVMRFQQNMTYGVRVRYSYSKYAGMLQVRVCVPKGKTGWAMDTIIAFVSSLKDVGECNKVIAKHGEMFGKQFEQFKQDPLRFHQLLIKILMYTSTPLEKLDGRIDPEVLSQVANYIFRVQNSGVILELQNRGENKTGASIKKRVVARLTSKL